MSITNTVNDKFIAISGFQTLWSFNNVTVKRARGLLFFPAVMWESLGAPLKRKVEEQLTHFPPPRLFLVISLQVTHACLRYWHGSIRDLSQLWKTEPFFQGIMRGLHWCMFSFTGMHWARHFISLDRNVMLCCDCYILINLKSDWNNLLFFAKWLRVWKEI